MLQVTTYTNIVILYQTTQSHQMTIKRKKNDENKKAFIPSLC